MGHLLLKNNHVGEVAWASQLSLFPFHCQVKGESPTRWEPDRQLRLTDDPLGPSKSLMLKMKQFLIKGCISVCSLGLRGDFLDLFHILMSIHCRSKSMPRQGTRVEVEIHLRSSLFPNWKELNSAIKHRDKVENQQWFLTRSNPHSSLPALCRLFITTSHRQCMLPLVICSWYKHRVA